jgi:hypothetical protein
MEFTPPGTSASDRNDGSISRSAGEAQGIDYFSRGHWLTGLHIRASLTARRRMFDLWLGEARQAHLPIERVLDVGTTPDQERADSNCMIPWIEEVGARADLYSIEDLSSIAPRFPRSRILDALPESQDYDWVIASAVIEHVGNREAQVRFLRRLSRAGRALFITTPNRFHWLEFHTKLPLLHWLPRHYHRALLKLRGDAFWSQEENLNLLSKRDLLRIAQVALGPQYAVCIQGIRFLGMTSNWLVLAWPMTDR